MASMALELKSTHPIVFCEIGVRKNFATGVFLRVIQNFSKQLNRKTTVEGYL